MSQGVAVTVLMTVQVVAGLAHMHRHRWIHRDVRLANILVSHADPLNVKLCDMGMARHVDCDDFVVDVDVSGGKRLLGPVLWMAPEGHT